VLGPYKKETENRGFLWKHRSRSY